MGLCRLDNMGSLNFPKVECFVMAFAKIKVILIDLSGTLHIDSSPIPGAIEALNRLRNENVNVRFVTNTTKESKRILHDRLNAMGFSIQPQEIFTSLTAARNHVDRIGVRPMLLLEKDAIEDFSGVSLTDPNSVVVGLAPSQFSYETMNQAFKLIIEGAPLIAIHKGRYYQRKDGPALGPGPFVTALEYATDAKAIVVGKPEKEFFLSGLRDFNCGPEDAIMIGDDVRDDVGGAQAAGMMGILVRTDLFNDARIFGSVYAFIRCPIAVIGKYRSGDENKINPPPDHIFDNFPAAVDFIVNSLP